MNDIMSDEEREIQRFVDEHRYKKQVVTGAGVFVVISLLIVVLRSLFGG